MVEALQSSFLFHPHFVKQLAFDAMLIKTQVVLGAVGLLRGDFCEIENGAPGPRTREIFL